MGVSTGVGSTIAGFFGDISRSEWVQLWSGVLGAVVSSGVAALVAVLVLTRSNKVQRKLAAEALAHQKAQGEAQLAEQRAEAARVREQAAIAEVIIATERFGIVSLEAMSDVRKHLPVFQAAAARWRVELGSGSMESELMTWTKILYEAACARVIERQGAEEGRGGDEQAAWDILRGAISSLGMVALTWSSEPDLSKREHLQDWLKEWRIENEEALRKLTGIPSSL